MYNFKTLTELIMVRRDERDKGITFILGEDKEVFVSYGELCDRALRLLSTFQNSGFKPGDEVVFQIDDNKEFIYSFWACILGGMIAVPVTTGTNDEHKHKLFKIWKVLNNPRLIAGADFFEKLDVFANKHGISEIMNSVKERAIYIDEIPGEGCGQIYYPKPDDIAFIQFSSGSTGDPKGVIITHQNVISNLSSVISWAKIGREDVGLNWMPLTHDMGLIGTHIKGVIACINQFNIHTHLFIRNPKLWIEKASEHKVTLLYSPNFGYKHFLNAYNPDSKKNWNLSSVRLIYNGAEPISMELCNEFMDKMSEYRLNKNAMYPVYGLAEGTIAVTFPPLHEKFLNHTLDRRYLKLGQCVSYTIKEDKNAISFMDVGYPISSCRVRICDEKGIELGEDSIGFIKIMGSSVTKGYYNNCAATKETISDDGWLNTGDLGFVKNGRLVITGRAKDVIFIAGQNYYSHDIERIAEDMEGIELGKVAAIGAFNDSKKCDELIIFVIFKQNLEKFIPVVKNLKSVVNEKMGIEVAEIIPIRNIPKTTSGKVQRYKLRESYLNGEYNNIKEQLHKALNEEFLSREIQLPQNQIESDIASIWSEVLDIQTISMDDNFFHLGGDSLKITQMISRIRDKYHVELNHSDIFENPRICELAALVDHSGKEYEKNKDRITNKNKDSITNQNQDGLMPLSFGQQRLWFLDRLNTKSPQYNLYTSISFTGLLNRDILTKSLNEVMRRHKVLKMSFDEEAGLPVQKFNPEADVLISYTDISSLPQEIRGKRALEVANQEASEPFDLKVAPLVRGKLICIDENQHILVMVAHHIVFDGWSFKILLEELSSFYAALVDHREPLLPQLKIQYSDYAKWQMDRDKSSNFKRQLDYWKSQLSGRIPVLDLPRDKQRPPVQTYNGARFITKIPSEMVKDLENIAKKENATLFMVLLSAFKVLLYRYTGQSDIIVGSPIANRNMKETEDVVGYFANNIVLRTRFSQEVTFLELIKNVKNITIEAYSNQEVPFERLVEELNVERDMSRNPIFQVLFGLGNTPQPKLKFADIDVSTIFMDGNYSRFDLSLDMEKTGNTLTAVIEYNTDLFESDSIVRMSGHYKELLSDIIKSPYKKLEDYEIMTKEEKTIVINEWNDTNKSNSGVKNWTELFEIRCEEAPDAIAAVCGKESITYGELHKRSSQLACYLTSVGAGPEDIAGVYIDRSIRMIIALMAIHKAGAAYLPMDPVFPKERISYMIKDAGVRIILTEDNLVETLPAHSARTICLDSQWEMIEGSGTSSFSRDYSENNLAYVIYTSGSTGKPKGVQIEQRALVNFLLSMKDETRTTNKDALLAVTTLSFDIAGLELFMPLISGARVIIAKRDEVTDGYALMDIIKEQGVTLMQATPATWRLLIDCGWKGDKRLRILCGGEAMPKEFAKELLGRCSVLLNVYGPTETTIWSTLSEVKSYEKHIHIGKPIANTKVYVLDKFMKPVPIGIVGELFIGGDGLARGYLNLPDLTEEKFVSNPFCPHNSSRLYRTGDLVRFLSDGNIEFIGRADNQVKIRGFRIELGEIESLLNQNDSIKESVVVVKEIIPGEKSLAAYIIPETNGDKDKLSTEFLRKSLKEKLPDYMVPAAFMILNSFPMTPNGKIDRKALPVPKSIELNKDKEFKLPTNEIEKNILQIWKEVLKHQRIGINENFFDLGGHSLLLALVRSKIKTLLNKDISMLDLFKYPTVATLAKYLGGEEDIECGTGGEKRVGIKTANRKTGNTDIAIIGLSGRFPEAKNIDEFWENLSKGRESISIFTEEQVLNEGIPPEVVKKPGYVKAWGVLEDVDVFDAEFFGYNPREAEVIDPQQRVFLEEAWKALESSGYDSNKYQGLIGVFASTGMNTYAQGLRNNTSEGLANDYQIMISNDKDFLATRIAYKLNLKGPGLTVQTACSSSLVAVHIACQSLINGECDMALAGGVSIRLPQRTGYLYQEGMILSPDGHCRAFDEGAKGTVGGNGAGVVVLKRLEDAINDGDNISAVIKGSAINNDGAVKIGYTAPSMEGQVKVIEEALAKAGVDPETISYIEAHGTGTPLGDPIEVHALTKVFSNKTIKKGHCALGSVKTNIGHLDSASGVVGLIKTVLSLRNKKIPPSINFKTPNPKINLEESPFFVNTSLCDWKTEYGILRAGVSSFGIGGTNAHVVLEEAPFKESDAFDNAPCLIVISAKTENALELLTQKLVEFLTKNMDINLGDLAYTLQLGRREFTYRRFVVVSSVEELLSALRNKDHESGVYSGIVEQSASTKEHQIDSPNMYSLEKLGHLWLNGSNIDWKKIYKGQRRKRVEIPSYPFEGKSFWVKKSSPTVTDNGVLMEEKRNEISDWFYSPIWKQLIEDRENDTDKREDGKEVILVILNKNTFADEFIKGLREKETSIVTAIAGSEYIKDSEKQFIIDPEDPKHYERLVTDIKRDGKIPSNIVNMLGVSSIKILPSQEGRVKLGQRHFYSMIYLARALGNISWSSPINIRAVTNNSQKIFNESVILPENSIQLGASRVIGTEYPNIFTSSIDIDLPEPGSDEESKIVELLIAEINYKADKNLIAYRGMERWTQEFEKIKFNKRNESISLKNNGVYMITGGLGGIGLALAKYLSKEIKAKLILVSRSEFPDASEWDNWINTYGIMDETSGKILKLRELKGLGSEIYIGKADVSKHPELMELCEKAETKLGKINGVIHAAGNPGGGMIQTRTKEEGDKVLLPKVTGTTTIYKVFEDYGLDFIILCSSLNAITGGFGQSDYSAANAFLDAFAQANDKKGGTRIISINWDRWPGVGMAQGIGNLRKKPLEDIHPLLGILIEDTNETALFKGEFYPEKDWVLSEHLVLGIPTIAGTTYLEMAREAFFRIEGNNKCEIKDVTFMTPMSIKPQEKRNVYTILNKNGRSFEFSVLSKIDGEDKESSWYEHVRGKIQSFDGVLQKASDPLELKEKCIEKKVFDHSLNQEISQEFISFGDRWTALKDFSLGKNEGLVEVQLPSEYISDINTFKLHPALLDVATGAVRLVCGGNYLPFSYEKAVVNSGLTEKIYGHFKFKSDNDFSDETITFDIDILDERGNVLVEITKFSMRLMGEWVSEVLKSRNQGLKHKPELASLIERLEEKANKKTEVLNEGITQAEGQEAFKRILKGCLRSQVAVSIKDIKIAIKKSGYFNEPGINDALYDTASPKERYPRPQLKNQYITPKNDMEKKLAIIWEDTLSIDRVGLYDDFFDLGGDSLLLVGLHTKLKEAFKTEIAVVDLYKYKTIALQAKYMAGGENCDEQPVFEGVNKRVSKQLEHKRNIRMQVQTRKGVQKSEQL